MDPTDTSQSFSIKNVINISKEENTNTDTNYLLYENDADDEFDETVVRNLDNNFILISDEEDDSPELNTSLNKHNDDVVGIDLSKTNTSNTGKTPQQNQCSNSIRSNTKNNSTNPNQLTINDAPAETSIDLTNDNLQVIYCGTSEYSKIYQSCKKKLEIQQNHQNTKDQFRRIESTFHNKNLNITPYTSNLNSETHFGDCNKNSSLCVSKIYNFPDEDDDDDDDDDDECIIVNEDMVISNIQQPLEDNGLLEQDEDCFEVLNATCDVNNACKIRETEIAENRKKSYDVWGCHICVAKFIEKGKARKHMMSHEEPWNKYGRFQCKKCPFRASWKGSVTRHKTLHTKANFIKYFGKRVKYFCPYCSITYDAKRDVQAHINEHVVSWKKFQCGDCMFSSNNSEALRSHYSKYHTKSKDPTFAPKSGSSLPVFNR